MLNLLYVWIITVQKRECQVVTQFSLEAMFDSDLQAVCQHFKLNHNVYPVTKLSTRNNNNNKVATTQLLGKSEVLAKVATHQVSS